MITKTILEKWALPLALGAAAMLGGCPGPAPPAPRHSDVLNDMAPASFDTPTEMVEVAKLASAPRAFLLAYGTVGIADLASQMTGCPTKTVDGARTTYRGGCTDANGQTWSGVATLEGSMAAAPGGVTYEGFQVRQTSDCMGTPVVEQTLVNGTVGLTLDASGATLFAIDLRMDAQSYDATTCNEESTIAGVDYAGRFVDGTEDLDADGTPDERTWNGTGRAGTSVVGVVAGTTMDEVLNDVTCSSEALSGTTRFEAAGNVAVVTYDGATDCSVDSTVTWTYNDVAQGSLSGVACAVAAAGAHPAGGLGPLLFGAIVFALLASRRRR